jgi:5-formyltetrahydrofolate cyclo-ligase
MVVSGIPGFYFSSISRRLTASMSLPTKPQLRSHLRHFRRALSVADQAKAGIALCRRIQLLPKLQQSKRVALYMACDGEIDPRFLADQLLDVGIEIYIPWLKSEDTELLFGRYRRGAKLTDNCFGIPQPLPSANRITASELDILALPLVGFEPNGNRLGMGGGYYDRALAKLRGRRPLLVGLAHQGQQCAYLPTDPWDKPLDWIATDAQLICCTHIRRIQG